jgi:hypothetical protein
MMWHAQEQKKRPNNMVASVTAPMRRKPAVMIPSSAVNMTSCSSSGARVFSAIRQCTTWTAIST